MAWRALAVERVGQEAAEPQDDADEVEAPAFSAHQRNRTMQPGAQGQAYTKA